jgi:hypothetical protein
LLYCSGTAYPRSSDWLVYLPPSLSLYVSLCVIVCFCLSAYQFCVCVSMSDSRSLLCLLSLVSHIPLPARSVARTLARKVQFGRCSVIVTIGSWYEFHGAETLDADCALGGRTAKCLSFGRRIKTTGKALLWGH